MSVWSMVQFSQARQIAQSMGVKDPKLPEAGVAPDQHYRRLVGEGRQTDAVNFLAHALPRYEMIAWVTRTVGAIQSDSTRKPQELRGMDIARRWVRDPVDEVRRQAWTMAENMEEASPERLLLHAIFFSGGSIAPEDLPPVHAPEETSAHLGGAAIQLAAYRTPSPTAALAKALEMGEQLTVAG